MICGLRFNGTNVAVGTMVGVDGGRGAKVSGRGGVVCVGLSGVREARSGADVTIAHVEEIMRQVTNSIGLLRVEAM